MSEGKKVFTRELSSNVYKFLRFKYSKITNKTGTLSSLVLCER